MASGLEKFQRRLEKSKAFMKTETVNVSKTETVATPSKGDTKRIL